MSSVHTWRMRANKSSEVTGTEQTSFDNHSVTDIQGDATKCERRHSPLLICFCHTIHILVVLQKLLQLSDTHFSQLLNKLEKIFFHGFMQYLQSVILKIIGKSSEFIIFLIHLIFFFSFQQFFKVFLEFLQKFSEITPPIPQNVFKITFNFS